MPEDDIEPSYLYKIEKREEDEIQDDLNSTVKVTKFYLDADGIKFCLFYRPFSDEKVQIHQNNTLIAEYTIDELRSKPQPMFIDFNQPQYRWHATIAVDQTDKPLLCLTDQCIKYDDLEEAPVTSQIYRSSRQNDFSDSDLKKTTFQIIVEGQLVQVDCQHDGQDLTTSLIADHRKEIKVGQRIDDPSQYPISRAVPEFNLELQAIHNAEQNCFDLLVNGTKYFTLPYKYDLTPDADLDVKVKASIKVSDQEIKIPQPWSIKQFVSNLPEQFESADISIIDCSGPGPINEILDALV